MFFDEIGELPLAMQPKLLRVHESRSVRRLGESEHRPVDVRFVTATHRDVPLMVARGSFRKDLYFRIAVLAVRLPPLRERPEDIAMLLAQFEKRAQCKLQLDPAQRARLTTLPWAGNVRELRNFVERAVALGAEHALHSLGAPDAAESGSEPAAAALADDHGVPVVAGAYRIYRDEWARAGERRFVRELLDKHGGNVVEAALEAQIDKSYLYRLIKRER